MKHVSRSVRIIIPGKAVFSFQLTLSLAVNVLYQKRRSVKAPQQSELSTAKLVSICFMYPHTPYSKYFQHFIM